MAPAMGSLPSGEVQLSQVWFCALELNRVEMQFSHTSVLSSLLLICSLALHLGEADDYNNTKAIFDDVFSSTVYDRRIRPVAYKIQTVQVYSNFELVSIVNVDDVGQKFIVNGFLVLGWLDQRLIWDAAKYGGVDFVRPEVQDIWKPRTVLFNTLDKRDLFEDLHAPFSVGANGFVSWIPGGLFPTSCDLDMSNYPFDEQNCVLKLSTMGVTTAEVTYIGSNEAVGETFFTPNGEWSLTKSNVTAGVIALGDDDDDAKMSAIIVSFTLKRRPTFLLLNVAMPVILLSFLNILVFLIPVDSGEKIGFGVTLLLAVSVFLSIVSGMLPRSSQVVPSVTIYLACLLIMSVLTVVDSVIIVLLHHLDESEDASIKAQENFRRVAEDVKKQNKNSVSPAPRMAFLASAAMQIKRPQVFTGGESSGRQFTSRSESSLSETSLPPYELEDSKNPGKQPGQSPSSSERRPRRSRYKTICKYIDMVSFVVFFLIWLGLTVGFLVAMSSG